MEAEPEPEAEAGGPNVPAGEVGRDVPGSTFSASHTQLLMDAEESRLRGFRPDEEVVMPLPVWSDSDED